MAAINLAELAEKIVEESGTYTGGPIRHFEAAGRNTFIAALRNGLMPDDKLLDFGAGCLRLGFWFARFLDSGNYFAIEPMENMIDAGKKYLFGEQLLRQKKPRFLVSGKCDMTTFGETFDFVVARSILTHTTPGMLHKIFAEFSACGASDATMIASYWAATGAHRMRAEGVIGDELARDDWRFLPVIKYSIDYLQEVAAGYKLRIEEDFHAEDLILNRQIWLTIKRVAG